MPFVLDNSVAMAWFFEDEAAPDLRLALDTGATGTMVNIGPLATVGYDPSLAPDRVQVTTGSSVEFVPLITISDLKALGHERAGFPVLGHTLNIDFRSGLITLG